MRSFFSGFVGAAMLMGASAASAQDYTWTLTDFWFDRYGPTSPWSNTGDLGTASGTLVLTKVNPACAPGSCTYELKSFNFTTTEGALGISATYDYDQNDGFSTDSFNSFIEMDDINGEQNFRIIWYDAGLTDEMDFNNLGAEVPLDGNQSYEYFGAQRRYNGTGVERCVVDDNFTTTCFDTNPGVMTLSSISRAPDPVATPEPASMAVLGAGLLGLFAARRARRKA